MINPTLYVNKSFKYQVDKCINITFGNVTQPFIKNSMTNNNTSVLALIIFHEIRHTNAKKYFRVLICVVYVIIDNFVCIDYLYFQSKKLNEICVDGKYLVRYFNEFLGFGIPYLLITSLLCHGFTKNIECIVILKCPRRML